MCLFFSGTLLCWCHIVSRSSDGVIGSPELCTGSPDIQRGQILVILTVCAKHNDTGVTMGRKRTGQFSLVRCGTPGCIGVQSVKEVTVPHHLIPNVALKGQG